MRPDTDSGRDAWGKTPQAAYIPRQTMSANEGAVAVPPVEDVVSELVATLALCAHAYLEPTEQGKEPDLDSASIAIDTAGEAFARISTRLKSEQHAALSSLLTDIRMTYVRKRGP